MFKIFFGDIKIGKIRRLAFLGYSLLIQIVVFGFVFFIVYTMGISEELLNEDLFEIQSLIKNNGILLFFIIVFVIGMSLAIFAGTNLIAKRIRDIGLSGWLTVLIIFILQINILLFMSEQIYSGLQLILTITLILTPTGLLNNKKN